MFLYLRVLSGEASTLDGEPDINDSRPCPPFQGCSGGGGG